MDHMSLQELQTRWDRCRRLLHQHLPHAEGLLVFSRLNIYYLTGTFGNGLFWLPLEGEPVFLCRRGCDRAKMESLVRNIVPFYSYKEPRALRNGVAAGKPLLPR
jgi:Xaa-Pro aminopeptidase